MVKKRKLFFRAAPKILRYPLSAQTSLEFVTIVICVIAALLAMQVYLKRSVQGRLKESADSIGKQYDPASSVSNTTYAQDSDSTSSTQMFEEGGKIKTVTTVTLNSSSESRTGTESVGNL